MARLVLLLGLLWSEALQAGADWMSKLDGRRSLDSVEIPGTHNSCALFGGIYGQCQDLTLTQQLQAGVRFLDIRCRAMNDTFEVYHGPFHQAISFKQVGELCADFLKEHPGECLLMSIKAEHLPVGNTLTFGQIFLNYTRSNQDLWHQSQRVPTLDEVRGKVVIISRHPQVRGIPWRKQSVQDAFKVRDISEKWKKVKQHLVKQKEAEQRVLSFNFCSGTGIWNPPRKVARKINGLLGRELEKKQTPNLGVVVMDFPSEELIQSIWRRNLKGIEN